MKYLIVQDWPSTRGNHAGMDHMCDMLVKEYPEEFVKIKNDKPPKNIKGTSFFKKIYRILYRVYYKNFSKKTYLKLCSPFFSKFKDDDEIFLLEYNFKEIAQYELGHFLRKKFPFLKIYALTHMTSSLLQLLKMDKSILNHDVILDRELTLGNSLSTYFLQIGVPSEKISTGLHYVDSNYYCKNEESIKEVDRLTVLMMGGMLRNYSLLSEIVHRTLNVNWVVCRGRNESIDLLFKDCSNVVLKGFLSEEELKLQMDLADVSINVMEDTVGSNVITTSMSMGLAMVVSDVGSIRDYCDESNAFFCPNTVESFVDALNRLASNKSMTKQMRLASLKKSKMFSIEYVKKWFDSLGG